MQEKQTRDILIRNLPLDVYLLLEKSAKEHHRSKTQEAIVAITNGLNIYRNSLKKPKPFKWKKRVSNKLVEDAIHEGRE
jgi:hypothetical protein